MLNVCRCKLLSLDGTQSIGDELLRDDRRSNRGALILLETVANYGTNYVLKM